MLSVFLIFIKIIVNFYNFNFKKNYKNFKRNMNIKTNLFQKHIPQ